VRATPLKLDSDCHIGDAFVAVARNCIDHLRANEAAVESSDNNEAIHQFRVAIRRFRAAIGVYRELIDDGAHAAMAIDLRWLQRQFGPARDLDVLVADTLEPMQERLSGLGLMNEVVEIAKTARTEARRRAHFALENPRYAVMLIQIYRLLLTEGWRGTSPDIRLRLQCPARDFADQLLAKAHKRLVRHGDDEAKMSEADMHRLRLLAKKMRYVTQAFASFYSSRKAERYLSHLAAIQDQLGSLNDAVVGRLLLSGLMERASADCGTGAIENQHLQGVILGWQSCRISQDLHGFRTTWRAFRDQRKFWGTD
jgi:CHAD domain-containing protein